MWNNFSHVLPHYTASEMPPTPRSPTEKTSKAIRKRKTILQLSSQDSVGLYSRRMGNCPKSACIHGRALGSYPKWTCYRTQRQIWVHTAYCLLQSWPLFFHPWTCGKSCLLNNSPFLPVKIHLPRLLWLLCKTRFSWPWRLFVGQGLI